MSSFEIEWGVRQGDLLLPYLFIIAAEILAVAIRNTKDIKGRDLSLFGKATIINSLLLPKMLFVFRFKQLREIS